jgi:hypothetical protein
MTDQAPGTHSLSDIQHALGIGRSALKKLRETLNKEKHETTLALAALGVQYIPGVGRGSKSCLMKVA